MSKTRTVVISFSIPTIVYEENDSLGDAEWDIRNYIQKTIMEDDPLNGITSIEIKDNELEERHE